MFEKVRGVFQSAQEITSELWPPQLFEVRLRSPACDYALLPLAGPGTEVSGGGGVDRRGAACLLAWWDSEPSVSVQKGPVLKAPPADLSLAA